MKKLLIMSIALLFGVTVGFAQTPAKTVKSVSSSTQSAFNKAKSAAKTVKNSTVSKPSRKGTQSEPIRLIDDNTGSSKSSSVSRKGTQSEPIRLIDDNTGSSKSSSVSRKGTQSEPIRLIDDNTGSSKSKSKLGTKSGIVGNDTDGPTGDFNRSAGSQKTRVSNPLRR